MTVDNAHEATVVGVWADHQKVTLKVWIEDEVGRFVCTAWLGVPRKTAANMVSWIDAEIEAEAQRSLFELEEVAEPPNLRFVPPKRS